MTMRKMHANIRKASNPMKRNYFLFILAIISMSYFSSCNMTKWLDTHRMEIIRLSQSSLSEQEKFDGLAETLATVMEQSLKFINPVKSYKYVNTFLDQNQRELDLLYNELNAWQQHMNTTEKISFGARSARKPYAKRLIDVVPAFRNKVENNVKTIIFLGKLLKLFNPLKILT